MISILDFIYWSILSTIHQKRIFDAHIFTIYIFGYFFTLYIVLLFVTYITLDYRLTVITLLEQIYRLTIHQQNRYECVKMLSHINQYYGLFLVKCHQLYYNSLFRKHWLMVKNIGSYIQLCNNMIIAHIQRHLSTIKFDKQLQKDLTELKETTKKLNLF